MVPLYIVLCVCPQVDSRGQNFLHLAVLREDVEAVIFLLSVRADVNSKAQNSALTTPLHYALKAGSEILVRHLVGGVKALLSDFNCWGKGGGRQTLNPWVL